MLLRDIIDLDATYGGGPDEEAAKATNGEDVSDNGEDKAEPEPEATAPGGAQTDGDDEGIAAARGLDGPQLGAREPDEAAGLRLVLLDGGLQLAERDELQP